MFEAQYLISVVEAGTSVYSPWFPSGGANARLTLDLIQVIDGSFAVELQTKNSEEQGDAGTIVATLGATTTVGQTPFTTTAGTKELCRYKFTTFASADGTIGIMLFRMLAPTWFDAVKA